MNSFLSTLPILLPVAYAWAEKQEIILQERGSPLKEEQIADARRAGVVAPEKIRITYAEALPHPENDDVLFTAKRVGLFASHSVSLTIGHGICLTHGHWDNRLTFVHECVHVSQYERLGGVRPFLNVYLRECIDPGYPFGRLEQEAIHIARDICRQGAAHRTRRLPNAGFLLGSVLGIARWNIYYRNEFKAPHRHHRRRA